MTQFLSRTVVHVLCDWMKVCTFRIIWSNSRGQLRPQQLGHSWIQRPQPTLGLSWSRDNSIDRRTRIASRCRVLKDKLTKSIWGPWALATSPTFAFVFLLPKSSLSWRLVLKL